VRGVRPPSYRAGLLALNASDHVPTNRGRSGFPFEVGGQLGDFGTCLLFARLTKRIASESNQFDDVG
jgi:hypothetical protein